MKRKPLISSVILIAAFLHSAGQDGASNLEFVENKGQWDEQVSFKGDMNAGAFFLQKQGFTVLLYNPDDWVRLTESHHGQTPANAGTANVKSGAMGTSGKIAPSQPPVTGEYGSGKGSGPGAEMMLHSHAYKVFFEGANEQVEIIPDKPLPGYNNYFIGNDPSKWAGKCKIYQGVTYKNVYPNIDVRYFSDKGQLKYDIIVHPGGEVNRISMRYEGTDKLSTKKNQLLINTSVGQVKELTPYSYQSDEAGRKEIQCKYVIKGGNTVKFNVSDYSPGATLVIDPTLVFSTFTGSKASNWGFTATPGPDGSFYAGGIVFGNGFPTGLGARQPVFQGGEFDVGIIKFNSNGSTRVYATYLGGEDSETPHSLICDPQGNLIILGRTYSSKFPYKTKEGAKSGGAEMFVAKLNGDGSQLIGCMLITGSGNDCVNINDQVRNHHEQAESLIRNYGDDSRSEVILDGSNNIYVAASTQSQDFPIRGNVFQPNFGGGTQDGVVLKINPDCNTLIWSSYLGGLGDDAAFVIKPDPITGDLYVAGATNSGSKPGSDFPGDRTGVIQGTYQGGVCDGFVTVISADGTTQKKTTYLGTPGADAIYGIQFDKKGFPYVMGTTTGNWPVTPNVGFVNAGAKQFISKLRPDLSGYVYSTTFGTPGSKMPNISPVAFLVDRCENVYVSGWGGWIIAQTDPYGLAGTQGMPVTPDAVKHGTDNRDFYFIVIKKNASDILYGTFFGQGDNSHSISEHVDGGTSRYDQNGIIYQAICANCNGGSTTPFPTTPGVWSPGNGTGANGCNLAAVKIAFNFAGVAAGIRASVNGRANDTVGCVPLHVVFQDTVLNAKSYVWSFGDNSPDTTTTTPVLSHDYPAVGVYLVRLIAIDSNSCNIRDTVYRHIIARNDRAPLDFSYARAPGVPCMAMDYIFKNLSTYPAGKPFSDSSFVWDFGDRTPHQYTGPADIPHTFQTSGTYVVKLILVDTNYCNYPDTLAKTLRISPLVKAQFETPSTGCAPYNAVFNNTSLAGLEFFWDFGDGTVSTSPSPTHLYPAIGIYTVRLIVNDSNTCNKTDSTRMTVTVNGKPTAAFTFGPSPPVANTPMVFNNASSGGVRYKWIFGDGDFLVTTTMDPVKHLYNKTDTFLVCLVAFNKYGCTDTVCHPVPTLIHPLLDVPNAFTPGRFGQNGLIKVVGFGITHMDFRIYNRYGQLVFRTNDPSQGWDGTFNGAVQPLDVYTYTLEAEFFNGTRTARKGDITLIR